MGIVFSQPVEQPAAAGQEYPVNGARRASLGEQVTSGALRTFECCWWALTTTLNLVKKIVLAPVRLAVWLTPTNVKTWLAERWQSMRNMVQAIQHRGTNWLNRREIRDLTQYMVKDREVTEDIRRRIRALPQAAQREFNRVYLARADADIAVADNLRDLVTNQSVRMRAIRDQMNAAALCQAQPAAAAPAPPAAVPGRPAAVPAALGPPAMPVAAAPGAAPSTAAPVAPIAPRTPAELQAEIDRLTRQLADMRTQKYEQAEG